MTTQQSANELDLARQRRQAYEYLCHLEEARVWLEMVLQKKLGLSSDLENSLRNGVDLAILANIIAPKACPKRKIYDIDLKRFEEKGLHFKYTDNIIMFLKACNEVGLPKVFHPETLDLYDAKNTPKVIFCIHALAHLAARKGLLPLIPDLCGKAEFGEHEISKIQQFLEKSGVKMPAFGKIGGILADELSEDDAAVHAAVILVSEAIDQNDVELFMERLKNGLLKILRVRDFHGKDYFKIMSERKAQKCQLSELRKDGDSKEVDVYDKVLSHSEIQDCVTRVNVEALLNKISLAISSKDKPALIESLLSDDFQHFYTRKQLGEKYADFCLKYFSELERDDRSPKVDDIREIISFVNQEDDRITDLQNFAKSVSVAFLKRDIVALNSLVSRPPHGLCAVKSESGNLVWAQLEKLKDKLMDFDENNIEQVLKIVSLVCQINHDIDSYDDDKLYEHLSDEGFENSSVNKNLCLKYLVALSKLRADKAEKSDMGGSELLYGEICDCIAQVNQNVIDEMGKYEVVTQINEKLHQMKSDELLDLLLDPRGRFMRVERDNKDIYHQSMLLLKNRAEASGAIESHAFWHDNIQEVIDDYNAMTIQQRERQNVVENINTHVIEKKQDLLLAALDQLGVQGIISECIDKYFHAFEQKLADRNLMAWNGWVEYQQYVKGDLLIYYNHKTNQYKLGDPPSDYMPRCGYLNPLDIQEVCNRVGSDYDRELYFKKNIEMIVGLQTHYRTLVVYEKYQKYLRWIHTELPNLISIQSFYRTFHVFSCFQKRMKYIVDHQDEAQTIKLFAKALSKSHDMKENSKIYQENITSIVGLQAFLRSYTAHNDYYNLIHETCPTLRRVYKFIHHLEPNEDDVIEDREILKYRKLVYDKIRGTEALEADVRNNYHLIGVLINSKKTLGTLESVHKRMKKTGMKDAPVITISKEKIELKEKYGQLFYLLQRKPEYIARLMFRLSLDSQHSKFIKEFFVILFSYGTTSRDEYMMMKAFSACIDYEVATNIDSISELMKSDPVTIKIACKYYRESKATTFLQKILADPINKIIELKKVLNINPPDVYRAWSARVEVETGQKSDLPADVTAEEALKHPEVCEDIKKDLETIIQLGTAMRDSIIRKREYIPYGIRYLAKVVFNALTAKFQQASEIDRLKAVAVLLYYRFINPATIDPIGFNVIKNVTDLRPEQLRNLGTISKILQNASVYSLSENTLEILAPLDEFTKQSADEFVQYFKQCIDVPDLEEYYSINQFSDHTQIRLPELKVTFNQIIEMHKILIDCRSDLFLSDDDILLKVIRDIGEVPTLDSIADTRLLSQSSHKSKSGQSSRKSEKAHAQTSDDIENTIGESFTLLPIKPPKELLETEENKNALLLEDCMSKLVDVLIFSRCDTIPQVLQSTFTEDQEKQYQELLSKRAAASILREKPGDDTSADEVSKDVPVVKSVTLQETLKTVIEELEILEQAGIVRPDNDYQCLVDKLIQRILQRRQFVKSRRVELLRFKSTVDDLNRKHDDLIKLLETYELYVRECILNITQRKKYKKEKVTRSAHKLMQDGIISHIDAVTPEQAKAVTVTISTTDTPGTFKVDATFIGIRVNQKDDCLISYQELLQLQYNNTPTIKLMDVVTARVSLLIYFINKHFLA